MINIKEKCLWSAGLFLVITGAVICGSYISKKISSEKIDNQLEGEIKKRKFDPALINAKWLTETVKVEDEKLKKGNGNLGSPRLKTLTH